jgi:hypothetical protein
LSFATFVDFLDISIVFWEASFDLIILSWSFDLFWIHENSITIPMICLIEDGWGIILWICLTINILIIKNIFIDYLLQN